MVTSCNKYDGVTALLHVVVTRPIRTDEYSDQRSSIVMQTVTLQLKRSDICVVERCSSSLRAEPYLPHSDHTKKQKKIRFCLQGTE